MKFESFITWADGQIQQAVNNNRDRTFSTNERKEYLLPLFLSYNNLKETKRLVKATWILAITTIILAVITVFV